VGDLNLMAFGAAAEQGVEAPCSSRSVMTAFPAGDDDGEGHVCGAEVAGERDGLAAEWVLPLQNATEKPGTGSAVKRRDFQCVSAMAVMRVFAAPVLASSHWRATWWTASSAVDFDQEVGGSGGSAPSTNSRLARGARKGRPRLAAPSRVGGWSQPRPGSKPSAEKKLTSSSK